MVNLLRGQEDRGGLRAAHQDAVALGNPEALYALDQLGQLLHDRRDVDGAHAVWQEAIDAGYEHADDLRERMMPESEKRRQLQAYPDHLPPGSNPANMLRAGIRGARARPARPAGAAHPPDGDPGRLLEGKAVRGRPGAAVREPVAQRTRADTDHAHLLAGIRRELDSAGPFRRHQFRVRPDRQARRPDAGARRQADRHRRRVLRPRDYARSCGIHRHRPGAPEIKYLAVIQDGSEHRRPLESHFGAWIVCTEQPGEFQVAGLDEDGNVTDTIHDSIRPHDG
jgi:hypothetical protein